MCGSTSPGLATKEFLWPYKTVRVQPTLPRLLKLCWVGFYHFQHKVSSLTHYVGEVLVAGLEGEWNQVELPQAVNVGSRWAITAQRAEQSSGCMSWVFMYDGPTDAGHLVSQSLEHLSCICLSEIQVCESRASQPWDGPGQSAVG